MLGIENNHYFWFVNSDSPSSVVVTAYSFKSDNTYQLGYYDKETKKFTWTKSGRYTQSGSTVIIGAKRFKIINGGKRLKDSSGGYWIKV